MGLNNIIRFISIGLGIAVISSTSMAGGTKSVLLTTDKNEIRANVEQNVSSNKVKQAYLEQISECKSANQYIFRAKKNTPNEIEFVQTSSNLAIFQMVDDQLETITAGKTNRE